MHCNNGQGLLKLSLKNLYAWGVPTHYNLSSDEFMIYYSTPFHPQCTIYDILSKDVVKYFGGFKGLLQEGPMFSN